MNLEDIFFKMIIKNRVEKNYNYKRYFKRNNEYIIRKIIIIYRS